jgi:hypothetical protein
VSYPDLYRICRVFPDGVRSFVLDPGEPRPMELRSKKEALAWIEAHKAREMVAGVVMAYEVMQWVTSA